MKPKKDQPQVRAQLVITLFENGQFTVNGPINDRLLYYGLLEMARDVPTMQRGQQIQQTQKAEQVKGSKAWWRKIFAAKPKPTQPVELMKSPEEQVH